ncbi:MAG: hypothetical protein ACPGXL_02110 [Chitinophagales bacterium]
MKKILLVIGLCTVALIFGSLQTEAQKVQLAWGDMAKEPTGSEIKKIIGEKAGEIYVLRFSSAGLLQPTEPYLERYNRKMKLDYLKPLQQKLPNVRERVDFLDIFMIKGQLVMFSSYYDRKRKNDVVIAHFVDDNGRVNPKFREVGEVESYKNILTRTRGLVDFEFSQDSSSIMIYHNKPYFRNQAEAYGVKVFDSKLNLQWSKDIVLPYDDDLFNVKKYEVGGNGNVYLAGVLFDRSLRTRRRGKPNYEYLIYAYLDNGAQEKVYKVNLGDKFISDLTFKVADNGDLICAGFYSDRNINLIKGAYYLRIDGESQQVVAQNTKDFSDDFLEEFRRTSKMQRGELYQYDLGEFILREDGGAVLLAEQFFIRVTESRAPGGMGGSSIDRTYHYNYRDMLVVNIEPDGAIAWTKKIPKAQVTSDDGGYYSSYAYMISGSQIYIVFNDNPKNLSNNKDDRVKVMGSPRKSLTTLVVMDLAGNEAKKPLFSNKEQGTVTRTKVCKQVAPNKLILLGERNRKYKFGKLLVN